MVRLTSQHQFQQLQQLEATLSQEIFRYSPNYQASTNAALAATQSGVHRHLDAVSQSLHNRMASAKDRDELRSALSLHVDHCQNSSIILPRSSNNITIVLSFQKTALRSRCFAVASDCIEAVQRLYNCIEVVYQLYRMSCRLVMAYALLALLFWLLACALLFEAGLIRRPQVPGHRGINHAVDNSTYLWVDEYCQSNGSFPGYRVIADPPKVWLDDWWAATMQYDTNVFSDSDLSVVYLWGRNYSGLLTHQLVPDADASVLVDVWSFRCDERPSRPTSTVDASTTIITTTPGGTTRPVWWAVPLSSSIVASLL